MIHMNEIEGLVVEKIIVNTVDEEINIIYLYLENGIYEIAGQFGSELIGIKRLEDINKLDNIRLSEIKTLEIFYGKKIIQVREIGEKWNGHGIEINFEKNYHQSLIIQSIYAGDKSPELDDCMRIGIANYINTLNIREQIISLNSMLFNSIRTIIRFWDPIDLFPYAPIDEYDHEIIEIISGDNNISIQELTESIESVFSRSFGDVFDRTKEECFVIAKLIENAKLEIDFT